MRKIVVTEFLSLDGVMENPGWTFPYWNDEIAKFKGAETNSSDALLLGRVTYEGFAAAWPQSKDEGAAYFNGVRKYVVSSTLDKAEWNNSVIIKNNVVEEIGKLKQQDGQSITVHGSGKLANFLFENNLVDEVRLLVYPLTLGTGQRLFENDSKVKLMLDSAAPIGDGGVVALTYRVAPPETK
jgi:dihydrofolate reductase